MHFVWIDCEMTGLDVHNDHILEIACIITDCDMKIIIEYHSVIYQNNKILEVMGDWCKITHAKSGLIQLVKKSKKKYSEVESEIIAILCQYAKKKETYIAGNSVYNDLIFIKKYMPLIVDFLHYRIFDISTFKILAEMKAIPFFIKKKHHLALSDIRESIAEYNYYNKLLFK